MGYMGFGMQKWIYSIKPRRPFSKDRKPIGNTLDKHEHVNAYTKDSIKLSGRINEDITEEEEKQSTILTRYRLLFRYAAGIFAIALFIGFALDFNIKKNDYAAKQELRREKIKLRESLEIEKAYQIILYSGNNHLKHKEYDQAITQFEQLVLMSNEKVEAKEALVNVLCISCMHKGLHCDKAIKELVLLYEKDQHPKYAKQLIELYKHLGQFEKADELSNRQP
ncbi:tetratricopeptide repeat protein [Carboxylicivirga sp. N1Y90]|uniref:tetratricopeptide repeat protein n=1 Tax=Carboxylicivirga fragile TaxID=3417571 RepID=UPI003D32AF4E|nr:hypothetical protein [Marinilabiliaceae bacterium N1Y90]